MDWLLIATGFTGALSLVYLTRLVQGLFSAPAAVEAHLLPVGGAAEVVAAQVRAARREVLVLASGLSCPVVAQALCDARGRRVTVELVLDADGEHDPTSDLPFLREHELVPLVDGEHDPAPGTVVVIDRRTVVTGSFRLAPFDGPADESVLVFRNNPDVAALYLAGYNAHRAHARPARPGTQPAPFLAAHTAPLPALPADEPPAGEDDAGLPVIVPFPRPAALREPALREPALAREEVIPPAEDEAPPAQAEEEPGRDHLSYVSDEGNEGEEGEEGDDDRAEPEEEPRRPRPGYGDGVPPPDRLPTDDFVPLRAAELLAALRRDYGVPQEPPPEDEPAAGAV